MMSMISFVIGLLLVASVQPARAQIATSESYLVEIGELLDDTSPESPIPTLTKTTTKSSLLGYNSLLSNPLGMYGASALGDGDANGVSTAIQMTIDSLSVDFGAVTPGIFATGRNEIVVNSNIPVGYELYVAENRTLRLLLAGDDRYVISSLAPESRQEIPDTHCDGGEQECTITTGAVWDNPDRAGFGYTVSGDDASGSFRDGATLLYKAFANREHGDDAQIIAGKAKTEQLLSNRATTVEYRVAIDPINEAGVYTTNIYYTLVPNF